MLVVMTGVRVRTLMRDGQAELVRSLAILATSAAEAEQSNKLVVLRRWPEVFGIGIRPQPASCSAVGVAEVSHARSTWDAPLKKDYLDHLH
jgi:hypothetical protein